MLNHAPSLIYAKDRFYPFSKRVLATGRGGNQCELIEFIPEKLGGLTFVSKITNRNIQEDGFETFERLQKELPSGRFLPYYTPLVAGAEGLKGDIKKASLSHNPQKPEPLLI